MDLNEYQRLSVSKAAEESTPGENLIHTSLGLCSEAGEFADALKKHLFYKTELDKENLKEELGDLLWYISLGAAALGAPLSEIAEQNVAKLAVRYPDKFTTTDALARKDKL